MYINISINNIFEKIFFEISNNQYNVLFMHSMSEAQAEAYKRKYKKYKYFFKNLTYYTIYIQLKYIKLK